MTGASAEKTPQSCGTGVEMMSERFWRYLQSAALLLFAATSLTMALTVPHGALFVGGRVLGVLLGILSLLLMRFAVLTVVPQGNKLAAVAASTRLIAFYQ
ncbi:MAG: hypothetical protein ACP5KN_07090 [Armatimonadota bacterium]